MSSRADSARPRLSRDKSAPSSLTGMEKTLPTLPPPRIESIIGMYDYKTLPPTPWKPVAVTYGVLQGGQPKSPIVSKSPPRFLIKQDLPPSPVSPVSPTMSPSSLRFFTKSEWSSALSPKSARFGVRKDVLPSSSTVSPESPKTPKSHKSLRFAAATESLSPKIFRQPSKHKPTKSAEPSKSQLRPILAPSGKSDSAVRTKPPPVPDMFAEWKAPTYKPPGSTSDLPKPSPTPKTSGQRNREIFEATHSQSATYQARSYQAVLHARSTMLPGFITTEPYLDKYNTMPSPMLPRITDVVDSSLVPRPLNINAMVFDSDDPSSAFSSSSSEFEEDGPTKEKGGGKRKLRKVPKSVSREKGRGNQKQKEKDKDKDRSRDEMIKPLKPPHPSPSQSPPLRRASSVRHRLSVNENIADMYDILTNLYIPPPALPVSKPKPKPKLLAPPSFPVESSGRKSFDSLSLLPLPLKSPKRLRGGAKPPMLRSKTEGARVSIDEWGGRNVRGGPIDGDEVEGDGKGKGFFGKIEHVVGLDKGRERKEKKREELKKRIVVLL